MFLNLFSIYLIYFKVWKNISWWETDPRPCGSAKTNGLFSVTVTQWTNRNQLQHIQFEKWMDTIDKCQNLSFNVM